MELFRRLVRGRVEVGVRELGLDTRQEPFKWGSVRDVGGVGLAGSASKEGRDTSLAVDDNGAGVTAVGERSGPTVTHNRQFHRCFLGAVREVPAHKRLDASATANGRVCFAAVFYQKDAWLAICVAHLRVGQLVFWDNAPNRK